MSSDQAALLGGSTVATAGQGSAPKPVHSPPSCLEIEWQQLSVFDLAPEVCEVIVVSRCPSTKNVYTCRWLGVSLTKFDPLFALLSEVLFVLSLIRQGLALSTVEGYLSAILAFLRLQDQPSLFKSPVVTHFFEGLAAHVFGFPFYNAPVAFSFGFDFPHV